MVVNSHTCTDGTDPPKLELEAREKAASQGARWCHLGLSV